ncbi:MAG: hypothetical protein A2033_03320 [Bacteroidetes bacterium GWA2_31_9]|nr:MAG: hypothetical protein A2033_03320 [Bacteroidetes bacterium GWA2_31_9]
MPIIKINNKSINYEFINLEKFSDSDYLLIFLHEGLGSISQWKIFPLEVSENSKIPALVYDRYGHGKSEILSEFNYNFFEEEATIFLPELIHCLGIKKKIILVGHSDGATIALLSAIFSIIKVHGIISISAHVFFENIITEGINRANNEYVNENLRKSLEKYHFANTESMFERWRNFWTDVKTKNWNISESFKLIKCPVLIIHGTNDNYGSIEQAECIFNNVSSIDKHKIILNSGHNPHFKEKEIVIDEIVRFICK